VLGESMIAALLTGHRAEHYLIPRRFILPAAYFLAKGKVAPGTRWKLGAIALGIGFQVSINRDWKSEAS
jgi:hypothetical protein